MPQWSASPDSRDGQVAGDRASEDRRVETSAWWSTMDWWIWPTASGGPVVVFALVLAADLGSPWRPAAALLFLTVAPGASLVPLIGLPDMAMELMLVIPLSFALVALSSAVLFYPGLWSPNRELFVMFGLCLVRLALQHVQAG